MVFAKFAFFAYLAELGLLESNLVGDEMNFMLVGRLLARAKPCPGGLCLRLSSGSDPARTQGKKMTTSTGAC